MVSISLSLPAFVAAEAGLSYLGIGVQGRPSWGQTIDNATKYWETYPVYLWEPVIGITVLCVALNMLGDALRDAFDPKTRRWRPANVGHAARVIYDKNRKAVNT